jgi:hypothetical protein
MNALEQIKARLQLAIEHGDAHGWAVARNELLGVLGSDYFNALRDEVGEAYAAGWRQAARWAGRDDLLAGIGSPAYEADKITALHWPRPAPAAKATTQDRIDAGGCAPPVYATPPSAPAAQPDVDAMQGGVEQARLAEIRRIIEAVDDRAMACDGDVPTTMQMMTQQEMSRIYDLARGAATPPSAPAVPAWVDPLAEKWACCLAADHFYGPALKQCAQEMVDAAYGRAGPPYSFVYGIGRRLTAPAPQSGVQLNDPALQQQMEEGAARFHRVVTALDAAPPSAPAVNDPEAILQELLWRQVNARARACGFRSVDAALTHLEAATPLAYNCAKAVPGQAGSRCAHWCGDSSRCISTAARLSAPVPQEGVDWQKRCLEHGFKFWRAPDAHGVECTQEQALALLRDLLGVEVDFVKPAATPPSAPAVEAIPQAAVWLEQNGQDATMEWQAGWDACRVEYPSRRLSAPVPQEGVDGIGTDDRLTLADVAGTLGEIAEQFDGGEYAVSEETRRTLIDFAHGIPDHPLFSIVGTYFAQNQERGTGRG